MGSGRESGWWRKQVRALTGVVNFLPCLPATTPMWRAAALIRYEPCVQSSKIRNLNGLCGYT
jgi:hypothetical protein